MTITTGAAPALVAAARDLYATLDAAWAETEAERRVPHAAVEAMRRAGLFRLVVPAELGGAAADLRTFVQVIELVGQANSAAAWDLAASSVATLFALGLPRDGIDRIYGGGPDVIFAGTVTVDRDVARAIETPAGYRVTGRWRFGSGCEEADWMIATAQAFEGETPRFRPDGAADMRYVVFPRPSVRIIDTWRVFGMRGTGSHDWAVEDAFVPLALSEKALLVQGPNVPRPWAGTLYRVPLSTLAALHFGAVATGIARRAIDTLIELAAEKIPHRSPGLLRERVQVQEAVARAEATLESARAYRDQAIDAAWRVIESGESLTLAQRAQVRLAGTYAADSAAHAVDLVYAAGGTTSIEDDFPLSRSFRDVHVIAQHVTVLPVYYENVGRVLLGLDQGTLRPF